MNWLQIALGVLSLIAAAVATFVAGRWRALASNLELVSQTNDELRSALEFERGERLRDIAECDRKTALLQGKIDVLVGNIGEVIAKAVLKTLEIQNAVQGPQHKGNP